MIITWHGEGTVKLVGKENTIAVNPHEGTVNKYSKISADLVLLGGKFTSTKNIKEKSFTIDTPGEYEVGGVFVYGVNADEEKEKIVLFVVELEGIKCGFLSGLNKDTLSSEQLEFLEGVDVLFVPVGGKDTLSANQAVKVINQIEPRIVIPIDYKVAGSKSAREGVDPFLKAFGVEKKFEKIDKLKLLKRDLPQEDTKVYVLDLI